MEPLKDDAEAYVGHLVAYDVTVDYFVASWVPLVHLCAEDEVALGGDRGDFVVAYGVLGEEYANQMVVADAALVMGGHQIDDVALEMDVQTVDGALETDVRVVDEGPAKDGRQVELVLVMDELFVAEDHVAAELVHEVDHVDLDYRDCAEMMMGRGFAMVVPWDLAPEEAASDCSEEMAMPSSSNQFSIFYPQLLVI